MSVLVVVGALFLVSAAPVAAAKPTHSPSEILEPLELPAGTACDVAVTINTTVLKGKTSVWEDPDGTVRIMDRGFTTGYAANDEGTRSTHSGGYRLEFVFHPDGSLDVSGSGFLFAWYVAGDPIVGLPAPGAYVLRGHLTESYAADGSLVAARFSGGKVVDLCEVLGS